MSYDFGHLGLPIIGIDCFGYSNSFAARAFVQYNDAIQKTGLGQDLLRRLNDDSRVTEMSGQLIPCGLHNSAAFDINILASWWIMRINEIGQSGADAELETYLQSDEVDVIVSQWIVGPNPSKVMSLGEGYDLCPLVEMPDSDSKERYSQAINKQNRLDGPAPRAAICKTIKRKKFMKSNSKEIHSISGETYKK